MSGVALGSGYGRNFRCPGYRQQPGWSHWWSIEFARLVAARAGRLELIGTMGSLSCRCGSFAPRRRCQLRRHSITIPDDKTNISSILRIESLGWQRHCGGRDLPGLIISAGVAGNLSALSIHFGSTVVSGLSQRLQRMAGRAPWGRQVVALTAHCRQVTNRAWTPCRRVLPSDIGGIGSSSQAILHGRTDSEQNDGSVPVREPLWGVGVRVPRRTLDVKSAPVRRGAPKQMATAPATRKCDSRDMTVA
jgi:hypothetical protein